jgi:hypothetical protein
MSGVSTKGWLKAALIRAIKTFAQTALASIGTLTVIATTADLKIVLSTAGTAFLLSILTSIAGLPELEKKDEEKPE